MADGFELLAATLGGGVLTVAAQGAYAFLSRPRLKLTIGTQGRFQIRTPVKRAAIIGGQAIPATLTVVGPDGAEISEVPEYIKQLQKDLSDESEGVYLRAEICNIGHSIARQCRAFITKIEFQNEHGVSTNSDQFGEMIPVSFSHVQLGGAIDVLPNMRQFIDIAAADGFRPESFRFVSNGIPLRYQKAFSGVGRYMVEVLVLSESGQVARTTGTFEWTGHWTGLRWIKA